jgi:m7GpppX diphosphatase
MQRQRDEGRLNWVFNILEGRAEQEDVMYREHGEEGFVVTPDLNWDKKTLTSLRVLCIVERRDIWSVRDLTKGHVQWLKHMREKLLDATVKLYPEVERDQLKLYVHCKPSYLRSDIFCSHMKDQPTYYHFHVHIVNVMLEAGATQAVGRALGLENIISQLEVMEDGKSMADSSLTYLIGEASETWTEIFQPLKEKGEL